MIGAPFLVLGLLLVLSALVGARVRTRDRGAVGAFLLSPLHPATWYATLAIFLGFWVELFAFGLAAAAFSSGVSLLFVGIGVVVIGLAVEGCRMVARIERSRATLADPRPLVPHVYRPYGSGLRDLVLAVFVDISRWRDVVYVFVAFPLTVLEFIVIVILWSASLALLSLPLWFATTGLPAGVGAGSPVSPGAIALMGGLLGVVLLPVAASVSQGLMALHRAVVTGLLCDSERRALVRRVETLEESRKAVIDVEATELRRIERDLHDGAQQRLVMLTIDLGMAVERIDTDPAGARTLVVEAQDQARLALAELRDLVRGIAPAILLDRGLVPALSAIASRCPVPTTVSSTLPEGERLPDAVGAGCVLRRGRIAGQRGQARVCRTLRDPLPARGGARGTAPRRRGLGRRRGGRAGGPGRRARRPCRTRRGARRLARHRQLARRTDDRARRDPAGRLARGRDAGAGERDRGRVAWLARQASFGSCPKGYPGVSPPQPPRARRPARPG